MKRVIVQRGYPANGKRWQRPGYLAVVEAPDDWNESRPLSDACLRRDGARILWREDFLDSRYDGPRSDYGQTMAAAEAFLDDLHADTVRPEPPE